MEENAEIEEELLILGDIVREVKPILSELKVVSATCGH